MDLSIIIAFRLTIHSSIIAGLVDYVSIKLVQLRLQLSPNTVSQRKSEYAIRATQNVTMDHPIQMTPLPVCRTMKTMI